MRSQAHRCSYTSGCVDINGVMLTARECELLVDLELGRLRSDHERDQALAVFYRIEEARNESGQRTLRV